MNHTYNAQCASQNHTDSQDISTDLYTINVQKIIVKMARLWEVQEQLKPLMREAKKLKEQLIKDCGHENLVVKPYAFTKKQRVGSIDYKRILSDYDHVLAPHNIDQDSYRKENINIWSLSKE